MNWTASEMGKKGGKISRRILTSGQAREMVKIREQKKHGIIQSASNDTKNVSCENINEA
jgi:hypothetical protein